MDGLRSQLPYIFEEFSHAEDLFLKVPHLILPSKQTSVCTRASDYVLRLYVLDLFPRLPFGVSGRLPFWPDVS